MNFIFDIWFTLSNIHYIWQNSSCIGDIFTGAVCDRDGSTCKAMLDCPKAKRDYNMTGTIPVVCKFTGGHFVVCCEPTTTDVTPEVLGAKSKKSKYESVHRVGPTQSSNLMTTLKITILHYRFIWRNSQTVSKKRCILP